VGELVVASRRLADGDLAYRPRPARSSREVQALVEAFSHMADAIHQRDRQLREQNVELDRSNNELTRLNRDYMEMLGFVTHELKSPLSTMVFGGQAILDGYTGELSDAQRKSVETIVRNAKYLMDMVASYLSLSRIEKGELEPDRRPIDLRADVVEPMLEQLRAQIDAAGMHVETHLPERMPLAADPTLLRIVVDNLISNAASYGKAGGRIEVSAAEAEGEARVSVWNEGEGIRADDLPRLFGKFVRLEQPSARSRRGTGLGLFVSREIVERHGGRIWAESEQGQWARFTFTIPLSPTDAASPGGPSAE
jgi:signal transduction histidine kinase